MSDHGATGYGRRKRRSSILKSQNTVTTTTSIDDATNTFVGGAAGRSTYSRRVSFAEKRTVKEFAIDAAHSPKFSQEPAYQDSINSNSDSSNLPSHSHLTTSVHQTVTTETDNMNQYTNVVIESMEETRITYQDKSGPVIMPQGAGDDSMDMEETLCVTQNVPAAQLGTSRLVGDDVTVDHTRAFMQQLKGLSAEQATSTPFQPTQATSSLREKQNMLNSRDAARWGLEKSAVERSTRTPTTLEQDQNFDVEEGDDVSVNVAQLVKQRTISDTSDMDLSSMQADYDSNDETPVMKSTKYMDNNATSNDSSAMEMTRNVTASGTSMMVRPANQTEHQSAMMEYTCVRDADYTQRTEPEEKTEAFLRGLIPRAGSGTVHNQQQQPPSPRILLTRPSGEARTAPDPLDDDSCMEMTEVNTEPVPDQRSVVMDQTFDLDAQTNKMADVSGEDDMSFTRVAPDQTTNKTVNNSSHMSFTKVIGQEPIDKTVNNSSHMSFTRVIDSGNKTVNDSMSLAKIQHQPPMTRQSNRSALADKMVPTTEGVEMKHSIVIDTGADMSITQINRSALSNKSLSNKSAVAVDDEEEDEPLPSQGSAASMSFTTVQPQISSQERMAHVDMSMTRINQSTLTDKSSVKLDGDDAPLCSQSSATAMSFTTIQPQLSSQERVIPADMSITRINQTVGEDDDSLTDVGATKSNSQKSLTSSFARDMSLNSPKTPVINLSKRQRANMTGPVASPRRNSSLFSGGRSIMQSASPNSPQQPKRSRVVRSPNESDVVRNQTKPPTYQSVRNESSTTTPNELVTPNQSTTTSLINDTPSSNLRSSRRQLAQRQQQSEPEEAVKDDSQLQVAHVSLLSRITEERNSTINSSSRALSAASKRAVNVNESLAMNTRSRSRDLPNSTSDYSASMNTSRRGRPKVRKAAALDQSSPDTTNADVSGRNSMSPMKRRRDDATNERESIPTGDMDETSRSVRHTLSRATRRGQANQSAKVDDSTAVNRSSVDNKTSKLPQTRNPSNTLEYSSCEDLMDIAPPSQLFQDSMAEPSLMAQNTSTRNQSNRLYLTDRQVPAENEDDDSSDHVRQIEDDQEMTEMFRDVRRRMRRSIDVSMSTFSPKRSTVVSEAPKAKGRSRLLDDSMDVTVNRLNASNVPVVSMLMVSRLDEERTSQLDNKTINFSSVSSASGSGGQPSSDSTQLGDLTLGELAVGQPVIAVDGYKCVTNSLQVPGNTSRLTARLASNASSIESVVSRPESPEFKCDAFRMESIMHPATSCAFQMDGSNAELANILDTAIGERQRHAFRIVFSKICDVNDRIRDEVSVKLRKVKLIDHRIESSVRNFNMDRFDGEIYQLWLTSRSMSRQQWSAYITRTIELLYNNLKAESEAADLQLALNREEDSKIKSVLAKKEQLANMEAELTALRSITPDQIQQLVEVQRQKAEVRARMSEQQEHLKDFDREKVRRDWLKQMQANVNAHARFIQDYKIRAAKYVH